MLAVLCALPQGAVRADERVHDERTGNVFFREPDRETARRIDELISRFAEDSVGARTAARRELEDIGYWSVEPLITALRTKEPPIRAAAALTLSGTMDRRGLPVLREAVERETSHPFVAGFACIGLARHRDPHAIDPLRSALRSSKSIHTLRAAAPLTLARIGTPEALTLLLERQRIGNGNYHVRSARLLAIGFFPQAALEPDRPLPATALRDGLRAKRRELRRAAVVGFLVATLRRSDTRDAVLTIVERESAPEVLRPALLGLSRFEDPETTAYLARRAARPGDDDVRVQCCDLLAPRNDAGALEHLLAILRRSNAARLRASAVVALGGIDHPDASATVLDKLDDKTPLVRAAAAFASVRMPQETARAEALARIEDRLSKGESSRDVRHNLTEARAVLRGEKSAGAWREVGAERLFRTLFRPYEEQLMREVNLAAEDALDLTKITNLQTDTEILAGGDPESPGDDGDGGDGGDGGDPTTPPDGPTLPDDQPAVEKPPGPKAPAVGSPRTNAWQELRDLKVELVRRPLFEPEDLPAAATTR
jgi:HEAT repeat protein